MKLIQIGKEIATGQPQAQKSWKDQHPSPTQFQPEFDVPQLPYPNGVIDGEPVAAEIKNPDIFAGIRGYRELSPSEAAQRQRDIELGALGVHGAETSAPIERSDNS
jgi:hypothetical protein